MIRRSLSEGEAPGSSNVIPQMVRKLVDFAGYLWEDGERTGNKCEVREGGERERES